MPELPEVETIVRGLRKTILNRTIDSVYINSPKITKINIKNWTELCRGQKLVSVRRRGKNILIELSDGYTLWVHLKMTGHFYFVTQKEPLDKHDLLIFHFKNCSHSLHFNDYRRFGKVRFLKTDQIAYQRGLAALGPEPLAISLSHFIDLFKKSRRMIKPALLDQTFLAGLGNIYADEALYQIRIHPRRLTNRLSEKKLTELHRSIKKLLLKAIEKMGTSVDSFSGVDGKPGQFQKYLQVYGRQGKPCHRCRSSIKREKIGSRSAHYCPRCQRIR
ncbi:MAG: DNA-formamidopyrimidine glycosylase [candidate division Zixibacteria bacterium]|nr:DNA-formamidopyrimidine glycosylase [candidate division Zixibacteria bacterium]